MAQINYDDPTEVGYCMMDYEDIHGEYNDFAWADMSNEHMTIVTVDHKYQPQIRFISDRQSIAEHSGLG